MAEGSYGNRGIAKTFALVFGIAYLAVALVELLTKSEGLNLGDTGILSFGGLHNVIHFAVGIVLLGAAFGSEATAKTIAKIIGIAFVAVSVWSLVSPDSYADFVGIDGDLPVAYTIVHVITAIAALYAGFAGAGSTRAATA